MSKPFDFTEGNLLKQMIAFSIPIFLTNILQISYQLVDSMWVGKLVGSHALGAVAISGSVLFAVLSFIIGINGATLTVLSQQRGKKDEQGLSESLNAFVVVLSVLTLVLGLVGYLSTDTLLRWLGTPDELLPLASAYLHINFLGILFLFGYNFIGTVLRAMGDSRTPLRFVWIAVILNAAINPLFIHTLGLGINGAAYSTVLSQGTAFLFGIVYCIRSGKAPFVRPYLPSFFYLKTIMKLGIPAGLQMMAISAGMTAVMSVVAGYGQIVVSGYGAANRIESIIMIPAYTLGSVVNSMAGQNIGAKRWDRVNHIAWLGIAVIVTMMLTIAGLVYMLSGTLISVFIDEPETLVFGTYYLQVVAFFYVFLGINFVLNGVIRASGAMLTVLMLNLVSFWLLRFPLVYLFSEWMGEEGIPYGVGISLIVSSICASSYFLLGDWRKKKIFKEEQGQVTA
ncbi:MATE family efflux transporter [Ammoniphilus sp. YIM 78166]|uniref:MATE family efflux transporter n=1 Tax=Ammoniphilus sp. YIM 78166 TaxID=1644106 RepID=UPI001070152B|nr:MATE family efflux transporter [Ammoniphilus sp. YIM 78166]